MMRAGQSKKQFPRAALFGALALGMQACSRGADSGPPSVNLGDSTCVECGMIVSDERFATSTIIIGERGRQPLVFDDFNCQINFEQQHPELDVVTRWSHDYLSPAWHETAEGWFVVSEQIRSPMASSMAFFKNRADADTHAVSVSGSVERFEAVRAKSDG